MQVSGRNHITRGRHQSFGTWSNEVARAFGNFVGATKLPGPLGRIEAWTELPLEHQGGEGAGDALGHVASTLLQCRNL
jgi:hypothetical protein